MVGGRVRVQDTWIEQHSMAVFPPGRDIRLTAEETSRIAVVGGEPLGRRFIEWNFVSSRRERIEQAKADWQHSRFAQIPDDHDEYIPLP